MWEWVDFKTTIDTICRFETLKWIVSIGTLNKEDGTLTFKNSRKSEDTAMQLHPKCLRRDDHFVLVWFYGAPTQFR